MGGLGGRGNNLNEDVKMVLTENEINGLKRMKKSEIPGLDEEGEHKCTICLEKMDNDENVILLECNHFFHTKCIETWFKNCRLRRQRKV